MSKIVFIHHSGVIGGAGISLRNVVRMLGEKFEIKIYLPSDPTDMQELFGEILSENQIQCYGRRIGAITYYSGGDKWYSPRFFYRLLLIAKQLKYWNRVIESENPDVVVVNSKILSWMSCLPAVKTRKSICFVRETMKGKRSNLINTAIRHFLEEFSTVVFLSKYDEEQEKLSKAESKVIHNYIDEEQFDKNISKSDAVMKLGLSPERFHVLYVGGVSEMKGFDIAVQAVINSGKELELIVAGNDFRSAKETKNQKVREYIDYWERFIQSSDKHNQIHMLGRQKDMSLCYAACDVLVFPMREKHQARPVFEAGYYSKPVIISDFDNIAEFVEDGYNGYTINTGSVMELTSKIKHLHEDAKLCQKMGENNLCITNKLHNEKTNCKLIKEIIEGLIQ